MDPWIVRYELSSSPVLRLFCLPHAGGGAATFHAWARELAPRIEVCAIVPPGRDHRRGEHPVTSVQAMADEVASAIAPLSDRPYALFGHSLGAAVAYEVAQRLECTDVPPVHVFAAGRGAPNTPPPPAVTHLSDWDFVTAVQQRYEALPTSILGDPDLLALFLPLLRADLRLNERYWSPRRPIGTSITALGGTDDALVRIGMLDGWAQFTYAGFVRRLLPGGHFFVRDSRASLLTLIATTLSAAVPSYRRSNERRRATR